MTKEKASICPFYQDGIHRPEKYVNGVRCCCQPFEPQTSKQPFTYVEDCTAEELSLEGIRKRAEAFNQTFSQGGGYKGYEAQAIDVLLARIDQLEKESRQWEKHGLTYIVEERNRLCANEREGWLYAREVEEEYKRRTGHGFGQPVETPAHICGYCRNPKIVGSCGWRNCPYKLVRPEETKECTCPKPGTSNSTVSLFCPVHAVKADGDSR